MQYNGLILKEHPNQKMSASDILIRFGVDYVIENSFLIVATFDNQQYFAMADTVSALIEKVSQYAHFPKFEGLIYKVQDGKAIPISCKGNFNIKNW